MRLFSLLLITVLLITSLMGCESDGDGSKKSYESFSQPADIEGISCSYVVYADDGGMKSCVLAREDTLSGQPLPEGTIVFFSRDGVMESCFLQQDMEIQGHLCKGHSDNWQTAFYPSGKLKLAWLAKEEIIRGVPCAASFGKSFFSRGAATYFYEDGSLASCKLASKTFIEGRSFGKGDRVSFDQLGKLMKEK